MGAPARSPERSLASAGVRWGRARVYVRFTVFLAIFMALVEPRVGLALLGVALTWVLLGMYERL